MLNPKQATLWLFSWEKTLAWLVKPWPLGSVMLSFKHYRYDILPVLVGTMCLLEYIIYIQKYLVPLKLQFSMHDHAFKINIQTEKNKKGENGKESIHSL